MSDSEILALAIGIALGAQLMTLLHVYWQARDDRRGREASRKARRRAAADAYYRSLRLYQLGLVLRATPHPAETLEAAVRDFELDLRDGLDRVERAAHDEGLL